MVLTESLGCEMFVIFLEKMRKERNVQKKMVFLFLFQAFFSSINLLSYVWEVEYFGKGKSWANMSHRF